jgi:hypothetical protein
MKTGTSRLRYLIILLIIPFFLSSQTADEIIAKHIDAHGGLAAWGKVDAIKVTGMFTAFSLENEYSSVKTKDGSYFADLYLGEKRVIEALHQGAGWTIDPWQDMEYARRLNSGELNVLMQKAEFITPFLNYQDKGYSVDYTGMDTLDGMIMHRLNLTRPNGKSETWYLHADTFLEYKCESEWVDFARTMPAESYFDDFRSVEGLVFPFFVERTFWQRDRILLIENIEINPTVNFEKFQMPRRPEMDALAFLEGTYEVTVEAWTRRGSWYPMGSSTSTIAFVSPNLLQEQITYERIYSVYKKREFAFNENSGNYLVSEYNDLTTALSFYSGDLTDSLFVFDDTSVVLSNRTENISEHARYVISNIDPGGFTLERHTSTDGGETWGPRDRFTYVKTDK